MIFFSACNSTTVLLLLQSLSTAAAFAPAIRSRTSTMRLQAKEDNATLAGVNQWLREYRIASGEVINPYEVLKVSRAASSQEVRASYISLSRRYHPDATRQNSILPGSCSSWDEARDEWERVKLSYEILRHPQRRRRFDRHETLADPGAAMKRAAKEAAVTSIVKLGEGVFNFGAFAVGKIAQTVHQQLRQQRETQESN